MSTINPPNTLSKRHELREDRVVTFYAQAWDYFHRHRMLVYGLLAGLVLAVAAVAGYVVYKSQQEDKAQALLGGIVSVYERGEYRTALDGTEDNAGLLALVEDYGGTKAGNLAKFYAASAHYGLEEYDQALVLFRDFDKDDDILGASAYAGEAAILDSKGEHARAAELYERAAAVFENEILSPQYLVNAGQAHEAAGNLVEARRVYEQVRDDYPESPVVEDVPFYLARVEAKQP